MYAGTKKVKIATVLIALISLTGMSAAAVQSADLLQYDSNNDFFDGPVMNIYFGDNDATDKIDVSWTASQLEQETGQNVKTGVSIDVTHSDTKAVYDFRRPGLEDLYEWETVKGQVDVSATDNSEQIEEKVLNSHMADKCADLDGTGDFSTGDAVFDGAFDGFNFVQEVYCVKQGQKIGNVGEIASNPRTVTTTEFTVENTEGKIEKATITNGEMGDGAEKRIGPNTHVVFSGQSSAGTQPAVSTDEMIMHSNGYTYYDIVTGEMVTVDQGWRVIDRNKYNDYKNAKGQIHSKLEDWAEHGDQYEDDVVAGINHQANLASEEHSDTEFTDATFNDAEDVANGRMEISSDELAFAQHNIYVNVCEYTNFESCDAMVEVEKTTGVPQINDVTTETFSELESGEVTVDYENIGEAEGSFSARIRSCSDNFEFTGVSQRESLEAGETHTASFPVTFSTTSKEQMEFDGSCTVEVTETGTDETVTQNVDVKAEQVSECTPGEQFKQTRTFQIADGSTVQKDVVLECVSETGETELAKQCDPGEVARDTGEGYECVSETTGSTGSTGETGGESECSFTLISNPMGGDITMPNPICMFTNAFSGAYGWFKLAASFAFGLFMYGLRVPLGKIARMDPSNTLRIFGTSMKTRWILGVIMGVTGFFIGLNFLSGMLGWIFIGLIGLVALVKLYTQGPVGLLMWLMPDSKNRR